MPTRKEEDAAYLAAHKVQQVITDAVAKVLLERPANPVLAIAQLLKEANDESKKLTPEQIFNKYDVNGCAATPDP